ncbi:MAG: DEAD/DEAH box helicase family protein [Candidatus Riflebacteria bacterium]|nr:DEAD/DEAH box helicase family protein [Candidatus Riflebacteria bacterium]
METPKETIELLRLRLAELESENKYLKELLAKAGIEYSNKSITRTFLDKKQGERIIPVEITLDLARKFFSYFWGRMDVFSKRYQNKKSGKSGYFPQCSNFWKSNICPKVSEIKYKCKNCKNRSWIKLEANHIIEHLCGNREDCSDVIGVYPLFPDGTCRFLVFDFDNHSKDAKESNLDNSWIDEVNTLREICKINNIPIIVERSRSGHGAHIWIFFDKPVLASIARKFGFALLEKGSEKVNLKSFKFYDRMIPAQDYLEEDGLGNLIALPLQGRALKNGNSAFIDENWKVYPDQWKVLLSTRKLSLDKINEFLIESNIEKDDNTSLFHQNEKEKPWELKNKFNRADVDGKLSITISNLIYIDCYNLKPRIQNQIRKLAAFPNPIFYKNKAMKISNFSNSRFIYLGEDDNGYICIPRGLLEKLIIHCKNSDIPYSIDDKRIIGKKISIEFIGKLKENQIKAVNSLLEKDNGILSAATAFGKTVVCCNMIAQRKVNTLIILESSALVEQWEKALDTFLKLNENLPEYITKSGRIKTRKSIIGVIGNSKDTSTGIIDIAMVGSLYKKGEFHSRLHDYGMIIVDECHHSASDTMSSVLREINAKYIYGVTATPFRGDGLEKINYMLLGPIRYQYSASEKAKEQKISHLVFPRFTRAICSNNEKLHINEYYKILVENENRNKQLTEDIRKSIEAGRTPIVLTKFTKHAKFLYDLVKNYADRVFLLIGEKTNKSLKEARIEMEQVDSNQSLIVIANGQLVGEGFDFPRLDTLFMADPIAWKGLVEQYAGRLNRDYPNKTNVIIYDYVDSHIPVFNNMYMKRLRTYKRIGYSLYSGIESNKQIANAIFDNDNYFSVYQNDLLEASKEVIISSPFLSSDKVFHLIDFLREKQNQGLKISIITYHQDCYKYGSSENRVRLLNKLMNNGFYIHLVEERCERYAVIDSEIVWYGNINLLATEHDEESIMRVVSKEIASELLEMTFGNNNSNLIKQKTLFD